MDDLAQEVSQKTGLPPDQAKTAATAALDYIKGKLPAPLASQIDGLLSGSGSAAGSATDPAGGMMDQVKGMLGGMMGGGASCESQS
jgi:hypothetical protein